ncbi:MAG: glycoside hydrolase family 2 TIM barrel-domain containing protein [Bacillota bacterium]
MENIINKHENFAIPLSEYPRPQLERESFFCLNGVWDFEVANIGCNDFEFTKKITVPFSPETKASGVEMQIFPTDIMHYKRSFTLTDDFIKDRVFLHFGGVDYSCEVFVNGVSVGTNQGGYIPFSFDITEVCKNENQLYLKVWDPTDQGWGARGKQVLKPSTIWYTPNSGIYQTVWIESTNKTFLSELTINQDFDNKIVTFLFDVDDYSSGELKIKHGENIVASKKLKGEKSIDIKIHNALCWSPESPTLYDVEIQLEKDVVKSYFGFRKFSTEIAKDGKLRLFLNNKPYLHNGLLDQGYWQESLLTPPSEEAMIFDIQKTKELGFNMLRKHIKIEPLRWYYHCDKIGMLVWQDFVSGGDSKYKPMITMVLPFIGVKVSDKRYSLFSRKSKDSRDEFEKDAVATVNLLKNVTSISTWTIFNEGWGQFDSARITDKIREIDKTRHIDSTSGWHDTNSGDFASSHIYFRKVKLKKDKRVIALSEFGGYSMAVKGHYGNDKPYGYKMYKDKEKLENDVVELYKKEVIPHIEMGLSAIVYTQVSDVEGECNGIYTYDRKVLKFSAEKLQDSNKKLFDKFEEITT